jgi:hypothetical protein
MSDHSAQTELHMIEGEPVVVNRNRTYLARVLLAAEHCANACEVLSLNTTVRFGTLGVRDRPNFQVNAGESSFVFDRRDHLPYEGKITEGEPHRDGFFRRGHFKNAHRTRPYSYESVAWLATLRDPSQDHDEYLDNLDRGLSQLKLSNSSDSSPDRNRRRAAVTRAIRDQDFRN